jgi:GNAT superfamily N-acetyltransferase
VSLAVIATHRPATPEDATSLFELRRKSILALAPKGMPVAVVESWAARLTLAGMERKLREMEVWITEIDGRAVCWGAFRADRLEGLYTDPEFANRGIGADLLGRLEAVMRMRGIRRIRAEASSNAEGFYLRRGYQPVGPRVGEGREIAKWLAAPVGLEIAC